MKLFKWLCCALTIPVWIILLIIIAACGGFFMLVDKIAGRP